MISQGFPLWAVHAEGDAYAVVGWDVRESISYPYLVPLGGSVRGMVVEDGDQVFRYTTTDPTEQPDTDPESVTYRRMMRLADRMENAGSPQGAWAAELIRAELAK